MPNDSSDAPRTAAEIVLDDCEFDRKYFLVSVPEFDVDPIDDNGTRKMTSYLRLGTTPDDWKSLPGAELELAVHADYGLGGGRDDLPIGRVVPGTRLPGEPIDPRYVPPTPENLYKKFRAAIRRACKQAYDLDAVRSWRDAEQAQVTEMKASLTARKAEADKDPDNGFAVSVPMDPDAPDPFPAEIDIKDFRRFVMEECASIKTTLEERLRGCALGGPTSPLDEREAGDVVDTMRLRGLVDLVLKRKPATDIPWTILAVTPFDAAFDALRADAAKRAADKVIETLTDYPDMLEDGVPKYPPFVDDLRYRGDDDDGDEYLSSADRNKNSQFLHTRGGWRDHSDGNRITTTYGDKIEVIRGNYKMMVLGRQDDPGSSNIVDLSGKITQTDDNMLLRVEWTQKDGVWNWETVNENIIESEVKSGKAYSWWYGVEKIDITGSDSPVKPSATNPLGKSDDGEGPSRANPHIIGRTWARSIKDYTGSAKLPVPTTYSETWIDDGEEKTYVTNGTIATTTIGGGTIETTTIGGGTIETTTIGGGTVSTSTVVLGTLETSIVGGAAISLTGIAGAQVEITGVGGAIVGVTTSIANVDISAHLVSLALSAVGINLEFGVTGLIVEISAHGFKLEGEFGPSLDINEDKTEITAVKTQIEASKAMIGSICTNVIAQDTKLATQQTQINTLYNVQSGAVFLG